jgi:4-amino-4-deoxy-L-arabinose transferase-like glycosyltransferase
VTGHSFAAVRLAQAVLDSVTVLIVYGIARQIFGARVALLAGLGTALYPLLIYETGLLIAETLSYTLQFAAVWCLIRMVDDDRYRLALAAGLLMGLTILTRPTATLWVPLILGWVLLFRLIRHRGVKLAAIMLGLGTVFAPWIVRNYTDLNAFILISSLSGTGMWTANNPWSDGGSVEPTAERWPGEDDPDRGWYGWSGISETESSRRFSEAGRAWIIANPDQFIALAPKKILRTWSPLSFSVQFGRQVPTWFYFVVGIPYVMFVLFALYGIWLARGLWGRSFPLLAVILAVNLLVIIYSGATRYGIPMVVSCFPFAALALDRVLCVMPAPVARKATTI